MNVAAIGHNMPPENTPFDDAAEAISDLFEEAKHWLDGGVVTNQDEANAIAKLLDLARKAKKQADEARKVEAKPFDDGKKAVQERYKPLLERADMVADACKKALTPYDLEQQRIRDEAARKAREEAEVKLRAAQEAMRASADLEARERAERLAKEAQAAEREATKAANAKSATKGGARAVSVRTRYVAVVNDYRSFARWAWQRNPGAFEAFLDKHAQEQVDGGVRQIAGVVVNEEKVAV